MEYFPNKNPRNSARQSFLKAEDQKARFCLSGESCQAKSVVLDAFSEHWNLDSRACRGGVCLRLVALMTHACWDSKEQSDSNQFALFKL